MWQGLRVAIVFVAGMVLLVLFLFLATLHSFKYSLLHVTMFPAPPLIAAVEGSSIPLQVFV
jgi:hypothetical protein